MAKPKPPSLIKIGPYTFGLIFEDSQFFGEEQDGRFYPEEEAIHINKKLTKRLKQGAVLHELLHAAIWLAGRRGDSFKGSEERVVSAMESPLLAILRENRELTKWLIAK